RLQDLTGRSAFTEVSENPSPNLTASGPQAESHLLACSLHQLSKKLHRCADDLLTKLRRQNGDGRAPRTPSPEADPAGAAAVPGTSCGSGGGSQLLQSELLGCLRHLQAVQLQVQALDRAIFPGQAPSSSGSAEWERINSELRGFQPIEPAFPATEMNFYTDFRYHAVIDSRYIYY
uniref:GIT1 n=1 Tax=Macrostomum lignano TaxID=282301 RepID=A0A1I8HBL1_9PLAT